MRNPEHAQGATKDRRRWLVLIVVCVGQLMLTLDSTVVYVALPIIQRQLHFSQSSLAWVANAYLLTYGGLLLLAGRLGDLVGRSRVFFSGLAGFTLSSLLCGLAQSANVLIIARFVQGASAATISAMVLGLVSPMFPEPRERTKAFSIFTFVAMGGASLGLVLGGIVTGVLNWHWIFFINVPIGAVVLILGKRLLTKDSGLGIREGADILGALLVTGAPMLAVFGVIHAGGSSWSSAPTVGALAGSIALAVAFVMVESRAPTPLVPLRIFHHRNLVGATVIRFLFPLGVWGLTFLGALYFEHVLGYSPLRTGLSFLPSTTVTGVVSLALIPYLVRRVELKTLVLTGLVLDISALLMLSRLTPHSGFVGGILPATLLIGAGNGFMFAPTVSIAMSGVTVDIAGVVSGLTQVTVQLGASLGLAVIATVSATRTAQLTREHESLKSALTGGYRIGFVVAAGFTAMALVATVAILRPAPQPAAETDGTVAMLLEPIDPGLP